MATLTPDQLTNTSKPLVYISVLNWYNYEQTINCLHQLEKLDYEPKTIIVVDNASPNDSVTHIRAAFPHLRIIQAKENLGYAAGHRHTVDAALAEGAELVWLINTDITFGPNVLSELVLAYLEHGDAIYGSVILKEEDPTVVGMNAYAVDDHGLPDFGARLIRSRLPFETQFEDLCVKHVANVSGCSMLLPLRVIRQHGYMDESFFMYAEELDYCFRLTKAGVPSYLVPSSQMIHVNRATTAHDDRLRDLVEYYTLRNRLVIYRRLYGWRRYMRRILKKDDLRFYIEQIVNIILRRSVDATDRYHLLAVLDSSINRMGKTYPPEDLC